MFDLPVATAMFQYLCSIQRAASLQQPAGATSSQAALQQQQQPLSSQQQERSALQQQQLQQLQQPDAQQDARVLALAQAFAASKRARASRVTREQRQAMYGGLTARMDALPAIFLRSADCQHNRPMVAAAEAAAAGTTQTHLT
jgi:hypothetical protein